MLKTIMEPTTSKYTSWVSKEAEQKLPTTSLDHGESKTARRNNLKYADITLMAENEEELATWGVKGWLRNSLQRRKSKPTPVVFPGKSHGAR